MTLREFFFENFAGDLEYHPRRAVLYLGLAVAALCFWIFSPREAKFNALPLVSVASFSSSWAGSSAALLPLRLGSSKSRVSKLSDDRTL